MIMGKPVPINEIITELLKKHPEETISPQEKILNNWKSILGEDGQRYARPLIIKNKTLVILVSNSAWLHQFTMQKNNILKTINTLIPEIEISALRFKIEGRT